MQPLFSVLKILLASFYNSSEQSSKKFFLFNVLLRSALESQNLPISTRKEVVCRNRFHAKKNRVAVPKEPVLGTGFGFGFAFSIGDVQKLEFNFFLCYSTVAMKTVYTIKVGESRVVSMNGFLMSNLLIPFTTTTYS